LVSERSIRYVNDYISANIKISLWRSARTPPSGPISLTNTPVCSVLTASHDHELTVSHDHELTASHDPEFFASHDHELTASHDHEFIASQREGDKKETFLSK